MLGAKISLLCFEECLKQPFQVMPYYMGPCDVGNAPLQILFAPVLWECLCFRSEVSAFSGLGDILDNMPNVLGSRDLGQAAFGGIFCTSVTVSSGGSDCRH